MLEEGMSAGGRGVDKSLSATRKGGLSHDAQGVDDLANL